MASFTDVTTLPEGSFDEFQEETNYGETLLGIMQGFNEYNQASEARKREIEKERAKMALDKRKVDLEEKKINATLENLKGTSKKEMTANKKNLADALSKLKSDTSGKIKAIDDRIADTAKILDKYSGATKEEQATARKEMTDLKKRRTDLEKELSTRTEDWEIAMNNYTSALEAVQEAKKNPTTSTADKNAANQWLEKATKKLEKVIVKMDPSDPTYKTGGLTPFKGKIRDTYEPPEEQPAQETRRSQRVADEQLTPSLIRGTRQDPRRTGGLIPVEGEIRDTYEPPEERPAQPALSKSALNPNAGQLEVDVVGRGPSTKPPGVKKPGVKSIVQALSPTGGIKRDDFLSLPPVEQGIIQRLQGAKRKRTHRKGM